MLLGINLLLWTTSVDASYAPVLQNVKAAGYDGVELPVFSGKPADYQKIGTMLSDLGLRSTAVAILPDDNHNCISPDRTRRQGGIDHIKWAIDCTAAAGGEILCGPLHQTLGLFSGKGPTDQELEWLVETHKIIAAYAVQCGIKIAIEPLNRFEAYALNTCAQASSLVRQIDNPDYGFLYDTFHANIEERDPVAEIDRHFNEIMMVHLSENDRGTPGRGNVRWRATLSALKRLNYQGWFVIEAFGRAEPEVAAATRVWRPLSSSPEDVYQFGHDFLRMTYEAV